MSSKFSLFSLIAAVFLILVATGQFQPVKAAALVESIDSVGVMNPDAERVIETLGAEYPVLQRRLKRGVSCYFGEWMCINSCYYQECSGGYCSSGTCRCVRCT
jgi:hypothetical protein